MNSKHSLCRSVFFLSKQGLKGRTEMKEIDISRAICGEYNKKLLEHLENDVVIVGAGPRRFGKPHIILQNQEGKLSYLKKKLSTGGGNLGRRCGAETRLPLKTTTFLEEIGVSYREKRAILYLADAIEFATALAYKAKKAGVAIFNLTEAEDIILKKDKVEGVVVNNTAIRMASLYVDPFLHFLQMPY